MFAVFEDSSPLVEPLSIHEAFLDVLGTSGSGRDRRRRSPRGCVGTFGSGWACRSPLAWRARSSSRRWRVESQSQTACSSSSPTASSTFLHPLEGRAALGAWAGDGPQAACGCGFPTVGDVAGLSEETLIALLGRRIGAAAPRAGPGTTTRGACGRVGGAARSALSAPSADHRRRPRRSTPTLVALVDRITRRMRSAGRVGRTVVLRLRFGDFSRATRSSHAAPLDGADARDPRDGARAARGRSARDRAREA